MDGKLLAKNRKAYFDYEVIEKYTAGIVLTGAEVKSIKAGLVQLKGSFAEVKNKRAHIENMHVSPYKHALNTDYNPLRKRELLLRRKELEYLGGALSQKGFTLIPLEIYLKNNLIKMLLGVCRGKKQHDKRDVMRKRDTEREIQEGLKKF